MDHAVPNDGAANVLLLSIMLNPQYQGSTPFDSTSPLLAMNIELFFYQKLPKVATLKFTV